MDDGGALGLFEADAGVAFAGLFALRLAVGVDGVEGLVGDRVCVVDEDAERGTCGEEDDEGPAMPVSDTLRVGFEGVGVVVREREEG